MSGLAMVFGLPAYVAIMAATLYIEDAIDEFKDENVRRVLKCAMALTFIAFLFASVALLIVIGQWQG